MKPMFSNKQSARRHRDAFVAATIITATQIAPAFAYVDPGSISIVVTAILGGIAAVGYTARMYIARVKEFFGKKPQDK